MKIALPMPTSQRSLDEWGYTLPACLGNVEICLVGAGSPAKPFSGATVVSSLDEAWPELPLVVIQPQDGVFVQGVTSLRDFIPPMNAVYYFGHDDTHMTLQELGGRTPLDVVYIPTSPGTPLYAGVAFWTVCYHMDGLSG